VSVPIHLITDSQRPVFLINSRQSLSSATRSSRATLLPKLRVYFAEFLNAGSLARLRILSSPTCVGLRYGPCQVYLRDYFSAPGLVRSSPSRRSAPLNGSDQEVDLPAPLNSSPLRPELPFSGSAPPHASSLRTPTEVREYKPVSHRLRFSASS
jgi:hypothetical protein